MASSDRWARKASAKRTFLLFTFCALLALAAFQAARLGLSGLVAELAQSELDHWTASGRKRPAAELDRLAGYFADSLSYAGDNPWALEGLASLDVARVRISKDPARAVALAQDARLRYRQALRVRPTSPYLWANLALSKLYLDQIDDEFRSALTSADRLGPYEPATQQTVVFAGLAAWDKLAAADRQMVEAAIERGGRRNAEKLFAIVKSYRRLDLVCGSSAYHRVGAVECRKAAEALKAAQASTRGSR